MTRRATFFLTATLVALVAGWTATAGFGGARWVVDSTQAAGRLAAPGAEAAAAARDLLAPWADTLGAQSQARAGLVAVAERLGSFAERAAAIEDALAVAPSQGRLWLALADVASRTGRSDNEVFHFVTLSDLTEPREAETMFLRAALVLRLWGHAPDALKRGAIANLAEIAPRLDPAELGALRALSSHLSNDDRADARERLIADMQEDRRFADAIGLSSQ
jgi:hypothetical protein